MNCNLNNRQAFQFSKLIHRQKNFCTNSLVMVTVMFLLFFIIFIKLSVHAVLFIKSLILFPWPVKMQGPQYFCLSYHLNIKIELPAVSM